MMRVGGQGLLVCLSGSLSFAFYVVVVGNFRIGAGAGVMRLILGFGVGECESMIRTQGKGSFSVRVMCCDWRCFDLCELQPVGSLVHS